MCAIGPAASSSCCCGVLSMIEPPLPRPQIREPNKRAKISPWFFLSPFSGYFITVTGKSAGQVDWLHLDLQYSQLQVYPDITQSQVEGQPSRTDWERVAQGWVWWGPCESREFQTDRRRNHWTQVDIDLRGGRCEIAIVWPQRRADARARRDHTMRNTLGSIWRRWEF